MTAPFKVISQRPGTIRLGRCQIVKKNYKDHDLGALVESFQKNGFAGRIWVWDHEAAGYGPLPTLAGERLEPDKDNFVIAGAGRVEGAFLAGADPETEIPCEYMAVKKAVAQRLLVADNEVGRRGGYDEDKLREYLLASMEELVATEGLSKDDAAGETLEGSGVDGDDLDAMIAKAEGGYGAPESGEEYVMFSLGDFSGRVSRAVYIDFQAKYHEVRGEDRKSEKGAVMDDVLREWLNL